MHILHEQPVSEVVFVCCVGLVFSRFRVCVSSASRILRAQIPGYPTWEVAGQYFPGEKDLNEMEQLLLRIESQGK